MGKRDFVAVTKERSCCNLAIKHMQKRETWNAKMRRWVWRWPFRCLEARLSLCSRDKKRIFCWWFEIHTVAWMLFGFRSTLVLVLQCSAPPLLVAFPSVKQPWQRSCVKPVTGPTKSGSGVWVIQVWSMCQPAEAMIHFLVIASRKNHLKWQKWQKKEH